MSADVIHLDDGSFEQSIQGATPILVDFWAAWCAPCKMISPTLEALAQEYAGRVRVGKVNVDENGELASRYGVQSLPTLILFHKGEAADKVIGTVSRESLGQLLQKHL